MRAKRQASRQAVGCLALFDVFVAEERDAGREDHGNEGRGEKKVVHGGSPLPRQGLKPWPDVMRFAGVDGVLNSTLGRVTGLGGVSGNDLMV